MVYSDFISNPIPTSRKKNKIRHNADKNISYIKNNGDYVKTSEELFQHSNTVRYRIRKAEQLLNLPENTANEEMAIVIRSYLLHNLIMQ